MLSKENIAALAEKAAQGSDIFVVEVSCRPGNDIEIIADSDSGMTIDRCAKLSRAVEAEIYAQQGEETDFSLTVMSAGVGQPLKMLRQYRNLLARAARRSEEQEKEIPAEVDILLTDGRKMTARLIGADEEGIDIAYDVRETVDGKKRKQLVTKEERILFARTKSVSEHLNIK